MYKSNLHLTVTINGGICWHIRMITYGHRLCQTKEIVYLEPAFHTRPKIHEINKDTWFVTLPAMRDCIYLSTGVPREGASRIPAVSTGSAQAVAYACAVRAKHPTRLPAGARPKTPFY